MAQWPNPQLRAKIQRQVAALAKSILDGRAPLVVSAQRMAKMLLWLGLDAADPDAKDFIVITSETDHLPLGPEREYWADDALKAKDREIAQLEAWARRFGLDTCRRLVQRFGPSSDR
jgi:hypothetical protein